MSDYNLLLNGAIDDFFGDIGLDEVKAIFKEAKKAENTHITLSSPGGDVTLATTIKSLLDDCKNVVIDIVGLAASAATIIACAKGAKVKMRKGSLYMIHNPWTVAIGDSQELTKQAETIAKFKNQLISIYQEKTGLSEQELSDMMDKETWLTDKEALELGFVDEIDNSTEVKASFTGKILAVAGYKFDCSKYDCSQFLINKEDKTTMATTKPKNDAQESVIASVKDLTDKYPALCEALTQRAYAEAYEKGKCDERARIQALDEIQTPANEALIVEAKYTTFEDAKDCAYKIQVQEKAKAMQRKKDLEFDASSVATVVNANDGALSSDDKFALEAKAILAAFKGE